MSDERKREEEWELGNGNASGNVHEKDRIRSRKKEVRRALSSERREEARKGLLSQLLQRLLGYKKVLSFASFPHEIDLSQVNQLLAQENRLLLPKTSGLNLIVEDFEQIECVLVPGLAFDAEKNRLGYGKGYYDRFLPLLNSKIPKIGVGFREQLVDTLPVESHDVRLDELQLF